MDETPETEDEGATGEAIGRLTVLMPRAMLGELRDEASENRMLVGEYVRGILREHLEKEDCPECGESVPGDADHCPYCGEELEDDDSEDDDSKDDE